MPSSKFNQVFNSFKGVRDQTHSKVNADAIGRTNALKSSSVCKPSENIDVEVVYRIIGLKPILVDELFLFNWFLTLRAEAIC